MAVTEQALLPRLPINIMSLSADEYQLAIELEKRGVIQITAGGLVRVRKTEKIPDNGQTTKAPALIPQNGTLASVEVTPPKRAPKPAQWERLDYHDLTRSVPLLAYRILNSVPRTQYPPSCPLVPLLRKLGCYHMPADLRNGAVRRLVSQGHATVTKIASKRKSTKVITLIPKPVGSWRPHLPCNRKKKPRAKKTKRPPTPWMAARLPIIWKYGRGTRFKRTPDNYWDPRWRTDPVSGVQFIPPEE